MASVTSLTATRILELMAQWDGTVLGLEEINAVVADLNTKVETSQFNLTQFHEETLPALQEALAEGNAAVTDLHENTIPDLESNLADNNAALDNLNTVTLPALQADLAAGIENSLVRPQYYFNDDPPAEDPIEEFYLNVNDVWYDTNNGNKQYRWDGTQWVTFSIDIPDLSLTVQKFKTSTHLIY